MTGLVLNAWVAPGWTLSLRLATVASGTADAIVPSADAMYSTAPVDLTPALPAWAMLSGTAAALPVTADMGADTPPPARSTCDGAIRTVDVVAAVLLPASRSRIEPVSTVATSAYVPSGADMGSANDS